MAKNMAGKVKINTFDDIVGGTDPMPAGDTVVEIPLTDLHDFVNHPFRVINDKKMNELVESIRQHGVLVPGIVRPRPEGGYEIIAGHRRKRASEIAGKSTMPVFVKTYGADEATILMVDSNIQREDILPSEKANAYKMKFEAMKHQGSKEGGKTYDMIGEATGESGKTVQRYIRLSYLSEVLLKYVDRKKISFVTGLDLSFLSDVEQKWVEDALRIEGRRITAVQSSELKKLSQGRKLEEQMVEKILADRRGDPRRVVLRAEELDRYFPKQMSNLQIMETIIELLEQREDNKGQNSGARNG